MLKYTCIRVHHCSSSHSTILPLHKLFTLKLANHVTPKLGNRGIPHHAPPCPCGPCILRPPHMTAHSDCPFHVWLFSLSVLHGSLRLQCVTSFLPKATNPLYL